MHWKDFEDMFTFATENKDDLNPRKWSKPLVINGETISYIHYSFGNLHILCSGEEIDEPLEYYNKEIIIEENKDIFKYVFGDV